MWLFLGILGAVVGLFFGGAVMVLALSSIYNAIGFLEPGKDDT